ncbi:MAG: MAPEG family protein [Sphingobium sp.]
MTVTISTALLMPAATLILWSLIMLFWLAFTRFSAFKVANIDLATTPPGGRGQDLEGVLPAPVNWPAHNYAHLMEQPTIFYPAVLILALTGQDNALNLGLAWAYVALRIVHSLWQATVNRIPLRFGIFILSTMALLVLAVRAFLAVLN